MKPRHWIVAAIIGACMFAPMIAGAIESDPKARLQTAEKMFQERCKKAGEFIHRRAENVEGIFLMKLRPKEINRGDQYRMDDPYGRDSGGETYIKIFFTDFYKTPSNPPPGWSARLGYRYVDATDPQDGKRYRYTGRIDQPWLRDKAYGEWVRKFVLDRQPASDPAPRYGVTYDDISTREERDYWIAGSSLKVIDLQTNEVMAERIGYMMDRGQGNTSGGRAPWLLAASYACPAFPKDPGGHSYQTDQTHDFVVKVLHPNREK